MLKWHLSNWLISMSYMVKAKPKQKKELKKHVVAVEARKPKRKKINKKLLKPQQIRRKNKLKKPKIHKAELFTVLPFFMTNSQITSVAKRGCGQFNRERFFEFIFFAKTFF